MKSSILSSVFILSQHAFAWDYHDMDHWSDDYPMCGTNDQSPINIDPKSVTYDESICTAEFHWDFKMPMVEVFKVKNTGHSISLTPVKQIEYYDGAEDDGALLVANSVNFTTYRELKYSDDAIATFDNNFLPTGSEHTKFCLDSLHFHWGTTSETGSEHLVDDHQYPLEVHFVHYSCQHNDLGLTLAQFPDIEDVENAKEEGEDVHQLGVIGFFFEISEEDNPAFDLLFSDDRMDRIELPLNASEELTELDIVHGFNLGDIIPVDYVSAGYYAYEGSLTTPPCTNIVRWHVMNAKPTISEAQLEKFRELMESEDHDMTPNYREVQDNENTVYGCMEAIDLDEERDALTTAIVIVYSVITMFMPVTLGVVCYYLSKREKVLVTDKKNYD